MNKLTIPAILVATVMVAGIFAFMPVEQASTVHTTGTTQGAVTTTTTFTAASTGDIIWTCGSAGGCVVQDIYLTSDGTTILALTTLVVTTDAETLTVDGNAPDLATTGVTALVSGGEQLQPIVIPAGDTLTLTVGTLTAGGVVVITSVTSGALTVNTAGAE